MYAAYVDANAARASHAIASTASINESFMRRAGRAVLTRAIRFTVTASGLLLSAELKLSKALNFSELVDQVDLGIFLTRQDRLQMADCRLRTNRLRLDRRICLLDGTRAQTLRKWAAAVAKQISDQHFAHILLSLGIRRDAVVLVHGALARVIRREHLGQA